MERNRKIIYVVVIMLLVFFNAFLFVKLNNNFDLRNIFRPVCRVYSIKSLDECYKKNNNVSITINEFYETGYTLKDNDEVVAKFIDIDLDGKSLIALVSKSSVEELKEGSILNGRLEIFSDVLKSEIINTIKDEYAERMGIDDIEVVFLPIQLNSYGYVNNNLVNIVYIILFVSSMIGVIILSLKLIKER